MSRPLVREVHPAPDPVAVLAAGEALPHPLLLESVPAAGGGRYTFYAADPFTVLEQAAGAPGDPFGLLASTLGRFEIEPVPGLPPFQGGLAGYLGYELHRFVEPAGALPPRDLSHPDLWMGAYDWVAAWDHEQGRCWIFSTGLPASPGEARERRARERMAFAQRVLACERVGAPACAAAEPVPPGGGVPGGAPAYPVPGLPELRSTFTRDGYLRAVERVRSYIRAGDVFQVNLSQRLSVPCSRAPVEVYRRLRRENPASYSAFVSTGPGWILSASPEGLLRVREGAVETRPIKGTAPRGRTEAEDRERAASLRASEKDRAENVMIVDLLRNDLSRVCQDHSIDVPELCVLESHPSVHHLVSTVRGRLRADVGVRDLLEAAFPGGSVTGAPKIRAVEIIGELEPVQRGVYTGAIGYLGPRGAVDLSVAIRTLVLEGGTAYVPVGGGIVLDSEPGREYAETLDKARGLLRALEVVEE